MTTMTTNAIPPLQLQDVNHHGIVKSWQLEQW